MRSRATFSKSEILKNPVKVAEVLSRLEDLFEIVPPDELRDTILEMYQVYVIREHKEACPETLVKWLSTYIYYSGF